MVSENFTFNFVFQSFIHNFLSLQCLSQDYNLASYIIGVVSVNFMHEWRDLRTADF